MTRPRAVDAALVEVLWHCLSILHQGRENAATAKKIRKELRDAGYEVHALRRIGEAVEYLIERGHPICSTSALGYWWARTAEEIEESLAETERRARKTLRRRRLLRRCLLSLLGQGDFAARSAGGQP